MYVEETFKTDIIIRFIRNNILCLMSHWPIIFSITVGHFMMTISFDEIKGKMYKFWTILLSMVTSHYRINQSMISIFDCYEDKVWRWSQIFENKMCQIWSKQLVNEGERALYEGSPIFSTVNTFISRQIIFFFGKYLKIKCVKLGPSS
jgi:hypothetical protein